MKSLYLHLGAGQIVLVNDGTLTQKDIGLLNVHLSPSQILRAGDIECG